MYLRDLYIEMLSHCKGTFGSENIEYKKIFAETLGSFVNVLGCDCYASCLDILVDLACKRHIFVEAVLIFWKVVTCLRGDCGGDLHHLLLLIVSSSGSDQLLFCTLDFSL